MTFSDLGLSEEVLTALNEMGFSEPTPIQAQSIPVALEGKDLIGQAQTGTGKTAAFGIPLVERIDIEERFVQALILSPTRELAVQISKEIHKLSSKTKGISVATVYGGSSMTTQIKDIKRGAQIVVGTPGRVIDLFNRGVLDFSQLHIAVLDEADEMLNMGFRDDIEMLLQSTPDERQTLMFSATMSKEIKDLAGRYLTNPEIVKVTRNELTTETIEQWYYEIPSHTRTEALARLIEFYDLKLMLVFCNTKRMVDEVVSTLQSRNLPAEGLHGDMQQNQRDGVMKRFRDGRTTILVATDVAARGIDVDDVNGVFNFDVPMDIEYYVHRIGRTGRAGREGKSFTFVTGRKDFFRIRDIERYIKASIQKGDIPTAESIMSRRQENFLNKIRETLNDESNDEALNKNFALVQQLLEEGFEADEIATALVYMNMSQQEVKDFDFSARSRNNDRRGDRDGGGRGDRRGGGRDRDERRGSRDRRSGGRNDFDNRGDGSRRDNDEGGRERNRKPAGPDEVRLFINLGRQDRMHPRDLVQNISNNAGLRAGKVGDIDIYKEYTFVNVPKNEADSVIDAFNKNGFNGKDVKVDYAK